MGRAVEFPPLEQWVEPLEQWDALASTPPRMKISNVLGPRATPIQQAAAFHRALEFEPLEQWVERWNSRRRSSGWSGGIRIAGAVGGAVEFKLLEQWVEQ
ncbi:hypothetical protein MMC22_008497 [Lobaria immixta]|nr:hypothetical protein [Lobaria immixta]